MRGGRSDASRPPEAGCLSFRRATCAPLRLHSDATATYNVPGLRGNRPLFLTYGIARDTIFPDTLVVEISGRVSGLHPPSATEALEVALEAAFL